MSEISSESVSTESSESAPVESSEVSQSTESSLGESSGESQAQESVGELQEQIQEAVDNGASKKEIQQMIKEFELKVNGKSVKKSIDLSNEDEIKKELQKAAAFQEVSQTHQQMIKNLQSKIEAWKKNPDLIFKDLEIDDNDYLEKRASRELEEMKLTPEQKRIRELEAKIAEREEQERLLSERLQAEEQAKKDAEAMDFLRAEITDAISKSSFLKPSEKVERRVADMMATYSEKYPNITAEQVLPYVEKEIVEEFNEILESMPEDYLDKFFKKQSLDKIGKKFVKPAPPAPKKAPVTSTQVAQPTTQSVDRKAEAQASQRKRSFEDLMASR